MLNKSICLAAILFLNNAHAIEYPKEDYKWSGVHGSFSQALLHYIVLKHTDASRREIEEQRKTCWRCLKLKYIFHNESSILNELEDVEWRLEQARHRLSYYQEEYPYCGYGNFGDCTRLRNELVGAQCKVSSLAAYKSQINDYLKFQREEARWNKGLPE